MGNLSLALFSSSAWLSRELSVEIQTQESDWMKVQFTPQTMLI